MIILLVIIVSILIYYVIDEIYQWSKIGFDKENFIQDLERFVLLQRDPSLYKIIANNDSILVIEIFKENKTITIEVFRENYTISIKGCKKKFNFLLQYLVIERIYKEVSKILRGE